MTYSAGPTVLPLLRSHSPALPRKATSNPWFRPGLLACIGALLCLSVGCAKQKRELRIRSFRDNAEPTELFERFDEAYYSHDARNSLDLVLRSVRSSKQDPTQVIRQVVHVNAFWKPVPGHTFVESTQCNATIVYMIGTGPVSISYEGAGFITFKRDWLTKKLTGHIESGELAPLRRVGRPKDLLGQAQITGEFVARPDKTRVFALLGELRRELGPQPEYTRPPDDRGPR
ncbi:MAG: hypothetical protein JXQ73_08515 [Phycisphaerae bacterium]|nr:hypothetical protein [Phycisphaerae bacterium]